MINESGFVRLDLLGGTLDLSPIDLMIPDAMVLNMAISLKAHVILEKGTRGKIKIASQDYNQEKVFDKADFTRDKLAGGYFKELRFIAEILFYFRVTDGLNIVLQSDAPPGSGLGGSSAMGIALFRALCGFTGKQFQPESIIATIKGIEARILASGPSGYQDYYPALYGGILGLHPSPGKIQVTQYYEKSLGTFLEDRLSLVYSGKSRLSGANNWEIYKGFFDGDKEIRRHLTKIAQLAHKASEAIKNKDFPLFVELMAHEGRERAKLFKGLETPEIVQLYRTLQKEDPQIGLKVCGAGGGGCFLIIQPPQKRSTVKELVEAKGMSILPFSVAPPTTLEEALHKGG